MTISNYKLTLLIVMLVLFSSNCLFADDEVRHAPPLSSNDIIFHMTCVNKKSQLLYTNVMCPEDYDNQYRLEMLKAARPSAQKVDAEQEIKREKQIESQEKKYRL